MSNPNSDTAAVFRAFADAIDPRLLLPEERAGLEKSADEYVVTASNNCRLIAGLLESYPKPLGGGSFYIDNPVVNHMIRHLFKIPRVSAASEEQVRKATPLWYAVLDKLSLSNAVKLEMYFAKPVS
jgi:hypothetical protein